MFRLSIDWKAVVVGAVLGVLPVVTVSLATASSQRQSTPAVPPAVRPTRDLSSPPPAPPLLCMETLQALGISLFVAATAAAPIWLIATAHQPHVRPRGRAGA